MKAIWYTIKRFLRKLEFMALVACLSSEERARLAATMRAMLARQGKEA